MKVSTLALILMCITGSLAHAQNMEQSATYVSQVDQDLTIRRIAILPVVDNVESIYARPVEAQLNQLLKNSHRWDLVETNIVSELPTLIELEENPAEVQQVTRSIDADAFLGAAVTKGPNGLSLRLDLFLKKDGKVLSQEILRDHPRYELPEIRDRVTDLYRRVIGRVPYDGIILSRQQNRVTINLGKSDGITKDQIITAVQIISINRHPKYSFILSTEKEILGRIKILKVDETLSFGAIIAEKERGAIHKFAKVSGLNQVNYGEPARLEEGNAAAEVNSRADSNVTFGKDPREWLPVHPPSFGQVGMKVGLGSYSSAVNLGTASYEATSSLFYPSIGLNGEIWLSPQWLVRAEMLQGVISTNNPSPGSNPSSLNNNLSRYSLEFGYNFLLRDDFFGPKITLSGGFASYHMYADNGTPVALTTVNYNGLLIGIGGSFPVTEDKKLYIGGKLNLFLLPSMTESGPNSGTDSKSTVNDFALTGERKIAENIRATADINFALYSSTLSGQGTRTGPGGAPESASSISQRHSIVSAGIVYMF
jgi:hypothetical protein